MDRYQVLALFIGMAIGMIIFYAGYNVSMNARYDKTAKAVKDMAESLIKIFDNIKNQGDAAKILNTKKNHIKVFYHKIDGRTVDEFEKFSIGNFIDMRSAKDLNIKAGEFILIPLGVSIELPKGFWGQVVPRSSLFKKHGLIQTNSFGVIDTSYCGENDQWMLPVYATRDTNIGFNERLCQFRIVPDINFDIDKVDHLDGKDRGGFGEGTKNVS